MDNESIKKERERKVFREFANAIKLDVESSSIESRDPPEPDIYYKSKDGEFLSCELSEICDSKVAEHYSSVNRQQVGGVEFLRLSNPSKNIISSKLSAKYETLRPINLLLYLAGRTATTPDIVKEELEYQLTKTNHPYASIWVYDFNREKCYYVS